MVNLTSKTSENEVYVTRISRALDKHRMTMKAMRCVAERQNLDLWHFYQYRLNILGYRSYRLVFIGESGFDKPGVLQRKRWAPKVIMTVLNVIFQHGARVQLLAAHTQKDLKLPFFLHRPVNKSIFEDFIKRLLYHCDTWSGPESVLAMENMSFYYSSDRFR